ncbi:hypothetical protein B0H14DRAFT_2661113 [Mycena olivaceomarginata]|nr:hypothetical protein B0H14DRAFT_2661113 [Mycena olivaceomarginata]
MKASLILNLATFLPCWMATRPRLDRFPRIIHGNNIQVPQLARYITLISYELCAMREFTVIKAPSGKTESRQYGSAATAVLLGSSKGLLRLQITTCASD